MTANSHNLLRAVPGDHLCIMVCLYNRGRVILYHRGDDDGRRQTTRQKGCGSRSSPIPPRTCHSSLTRAKVGERTRPPPTHPPIHPLLPLRDMPSSSVRHGEANQHLLICRSRFLHSWASWRHPTHLPLSQCYLIMCPPLGLGVVATSYPPPPAAPTRFGYTGGLGPKNIAVQV